LAEALARALAGARARWPRLAVPGEPFVAYVAERADPALPATAAVEALCVPDLYLACGCARGLPAAAAALDEHYFVPLRGVLAAIDASPAFVEDVMQDLRMGMLVGDETDPALREPKILQYRGRGALRSWLEVSAKRLALRRKRSLTRWSEIDELTLASEQDPELEQLRARFTSDFRPLVRDAVKDMLRELTFADRNLLRWHLVEEISLRKIALMRGSNVSSISRDYARVRGRILDHVRGRLHLHTGIAPDELDSVMRALLSRISISLSALLQQ
jgi:RNA polymerase sigma-70 factor (ECF subfamily)